MTGPAFSGEILRMRVSASCALGMIGTIALAAMPALAQQTDNSAPLVPETPLTAEESALLGNALIFDPAALATPPKKPLHLPGYSESRTYDIKRTDKADGSSTFVVKQPLQTDWENSAGADVRPANTGASSAFDRPLPSTRDGVTNGAAWGRSRQ